MGGWTVRTYRLEAEEPVSVMAWSEEEAAQWLADQARAHGPDRLLELADPYGTVLVSENGTGR